MKKGNSGHDKFGKRTIMKRKNLKRTIRKKETYEKGHSGKRQI